MSDHSRAVADPSPDRLTRRPNGTRRGARVVLASALALVFIVGAAVPSTANVGGGGVGGSGSGGTGASDFWLFTGDNFNGVSTPFQGWGQTSIDTFASAMEQQAGWASGVGGNRTGINDACGAAINQAIARSGGGATRARVIQVGVGVGTVNGWTGMGWGGNQQEMQAWYQGLTNSGYYRGDLPRYSPENLTAVHNTFMANIPFNPRIVCVAMNEAEPKFDYDMSISTDKSGAFDLAGSSAAVSDSIHTSTPSAIRENLWANTTLKWGGVEGNPRELTKGGAVANSGTTSSPSFTPADFGWTSWPAGKFWFDVAIAKQGLMANNESHDGFYEPRENWTAAATPPRKVLTSGISGAVLAADEVLASGHSYNAEITARTNGYTSSMTITDTINTDKVVIGSAVTDDKSMAYMTNPNGTRVSGATITIDRSTSGKVKVSGTVTNIPDVFQAREYKLVVPTFVQPTKADYTITDDSNVCYTASLTNCIAGNSAQIRKVTPAPDKVWVLDQSGALTESDPSHTNNAGVDGQVFGPGATIGAVVNGSVPVKLADNLNFYSLTDDWTGAAKYIDFSKYWLAKVFVDGVDQTNMFTITNTGTTTVASAKMEFLRDTKGLAKAKNVKLYISGTFKTDYDTDGNLAALTNSGSERLNNESVATNAPAIYTVSPSPDKVWVLNEAGALVTSDPNGTNNAGVDNKTFAPGAGIAAVINGSIPADLGAKFNEYSLTDDWTGAAKYIDFSNAAKAKVFADGVNVTSQFDITVSGTKTTAQAKAAFLDATKGLAKAKNVKLVIEGAFKSDYETSGKLEKLTNAGSESWNGKVLQANTPAIYTATADPDKVWVIDEAGALAAFDPTKAGNTGADNKTFAPNTSISAVVNGSVPANLGAKLTEYSLTDDWAGAAKHVDFSDASKAKVFLNGVNVTSQFNVVVSGTKTVATAKAAFLDQTAGRATEGIVKLFITGEFRSTYETGGKLETLTNTGSESWNGKVIETNSPVIFTATPNPDKVWVLNEAGALTAADPDKTDYAGADNKTFAPGSSISAVVNGSIPANLGSKLNSYVLTDDWTGAAKYINFSDAAKAKVFLDGVNVTSQFDVVVSGTTTAATAKAAFLDATVGRKTGGVVKLYIAGEFRSTYDTDGDLERLTNAGSEAWNGKSIETNTPAIYTVTPDPDKVWVLDEKGALAAADPKHDNTQGVDNKTFAPGSAISAVVNGSIPADLGAALGSYEIVDDWTAAASYIDFTDATKAKVFLDGVNVTNQFDITVEGTKTVAKAKAAFLNNTLNRTTEGAVKLYVAGKFKLDYDTDGKSVKFTNSGWEKWNNKTVSTNTPAIYTVTPDPDKAWVLDENGALTTADPNHTNSTGVDTKTFAPGAAISAVVNGSVPADLGSALTSYSISDDWTAASKYVDFSDATKVKVFLDGANVTSQFDIVVSGSKTTATAKAAFLGATVNRATEGKVKLFVSGQFRNTYDTSGKLDAVVNNGSESWNGKQVAANAPAIFTVTPTPDKVWVLDEEGGLTTSDKDWSNTDGADGKVFLQNDAVAAVVNGSIPANLGSPLFAYSLSDNWGDAAKYVDFSDHSKVKVHYNGNDVTTQFEVNITGSTTTVTATAAFLAGTAGLTTAGAVKLTIGGFFRDDYDTNGETVKLTNSGTETWNNRTQPTNAPPVYVWTPDPSKQVIGSAEESGDSAHSDINGASVWPGQKLEYTVGVDLRVPAGTARGVKTLVIEDVYDQYFTPDKSSVEFWDSRNPQNPRPVARSAYKLVFNEAAHMFTATFSQAWIDANVGEDGRNDQWLSQGWLTMRLTGAVSKAVPAGSSVVNQAFQIINGARSATEIPVVEIPTVTPDKDSLNTDQIDIDGKTVVEGDTILYRLTLDGGPSRDKLAYNVHKLGMVDDFDEDYLKLDESDIAVTEKLTGKDVTGEFNVQIKDGVAYVFAKTVDTVDPYGEKIAGDPQAADLAAYDAATIRPLEDPIIDQQLLGKTYWVTLKTIVTKEEAGHVIENQARQNIQNTHHTTKIVSNPLKDIDPTKDVVVSEETKGNSINEAEIKMYETFNYRLNSSEIPGDRAYKAKQWSLSDTFNRVHDSYTGIWAIYANDDIYQGSELIFKKGDLLADSAAHEAEPFKDLFAVGFDADTYTFTVEATKKYLTLIETRPELSNAFTVYTKMQRIAPSEKIVNTVTESYNEFSRESNTAWTFTNENPGVAVEKFTLSEGEEDGDRDDVRLAYEITEDQLKLAELPEDAAEGAVALQQGVEVGIRFTNTGDVPLKNVKVTDITHDGLYGDLQEIRCAVPADPMAPVMIQGGGATDAAGESEDGMNWVLASSVTELGYGETIDCKGTLRNMAPGMTHGDTVVVTGESVFTEAPVKAEDAWFATAASAPAIDVVKYTLEEGVEKGDRNTFEEALVLTPEQAKNGLKIAFGVTNTGNEPLTKFSFEDAAQDNTTGTVEDVKWLDLVEEEEPAPIVEEEEAPAEEEGVGGEPAPAALMAVPFAPEEAPVTPAATVEIGGKFYIERPLEELADLAVGESVLLVGTLTGVKAATAHISIAAVTAEGAYSGTEVEDTDPWNAKLPAVQVPPLAPPRVAVTGDPLAEAGMAPWLLGGAALLLAAAGAAAYGIRRRLRYAREEAARFGSAG